MVKVVKFGGSSLASAEQFTKVGDIIRSDESRKYVVPSAPGKRNREYNIKEYGVKGNGYSETATLQRIINEAVHNGGGLIFMKTFAEGMGTSHLRIMGRYMAG